MIEGQLMEAQRQLKQALLCIANQVKASAAKKDTGKAERCNDIKRKDWEKTNERNNKKPKITQDTVYNNSRQDMDTFKWGDMSDNETVTLKNQDNEKWHIIENKQKPKKNNMKEPSSKDNQSKMHQENTKDKRKAAVANPHI